MTAGDPHSALTPEIEAAAVEWLGLRDAGKMSLAQEEAFAAWLEADDRHTAAFAEIDGMWTGFDTLQTLPRADGQPDADYFSSNGIEQRQTNVSWHCRYFLPLSLGAVAALLMGLFLSQRPARPVSLMESAATEVGQQRTMHLPDGSIIRLNTATALEIDFRPATRRIRLIHGEANFAVAKDKTRPFIVSAGNVAVRAVGTAFNVRMNPAEVEVLVTEGRVQVDDAATGNTLLPAPSQERTLITAVAEPLLTAGNRISIPVATETAVSTMASAVIALPTDDIDRTLAWRDGQLEFESEPLEKIVAEFNRYNVHQLVIVDPRLKLQRFGGKFRPDGYQALVSLLQTSFGVQIEQRENETILRLSDGPASP